MAASSSFFLAAAVRRSLSTAIPSTSRLPTHLRSVIPFFLVERSITAEALPSCPSRGEESSPDDGLKAMIFRLRFPKRSATAALQRWVGEGNKVTASELRRIARDLRTARRYKHALEMNHYRMRIGTYADSQFQYAVGRVSPGIASPVVADPQLSSTSNDVSAKSVEDVEWISEMSATPRHASHTRQQHMRNLISEWMLTHQEYELSDSDYAVRIDLINKVFGTTAAEEFFEGLPSTAKNCETYTALIHAYAGAKLVEKAESLFERLKESSVTLSTLTYNEIMTLYVSVGQVDKVALVAEELKNSSVSPDLFTYNLRVSACVSTMDIDGVRKIIDEMCCDPNCNSSWKTYVKFTDVYISTCHLKNTMNSVVEAEKITKWECITYDFLVILYTALGNKERIDEIWKSLRMASQKMGSRSYVCIISSYLMLGHLKEAGEILGEWKQVKGLELDLPVCYRLYDAFLKADLVPVAEHLHQLMFERNHEPANIV